MRHRTTLRLALPGAVLSALVLAACNNPRSTSDNTATGMARTTADTAASAAATVRDTMGARADTGAALSDANIVALLDEANKADSAAGHFAMSRAHDAGVKGFAAMMMAEHHELRRQGQALAKKLNITPLAPAIDPVKALAAAEMDSLQAAPKGAGFDRVYIDQEVGVHKAVIDLAEKAHDATKNKELQALIEKAKPFLERHLDRAETLQKKLAKTTA
jgi:putative membrane protein